MVRTYGQTSFIYKIWNFILIGWEIFMLFLASLLKKDPRAATKDDAIPIRRGLDRNNGGGGGGGFGGGGSGGGGYYNRP